MPFSCTGFSIRVPVMHLVLEAKGRAHVAQGERTDGNGMDLETLPYKKEKDEGSCCVRKRARGVGRKPDHDGAGGRQWCERKARLEGAESA